MHPQSSPHQIVRAIGILFSNNPNEELRNKERLDVFPAHGSPSSPPFLTPSSPSPRLLERFQPPPVVVASV